MELSDILGSIIFVFVGAILLGIGICQYKSKTPVTFYTGEDPIPEEELTDVGAWNRAHGIMWIVYAVLIFIGCAAAVLIGNDDPLCIIPYLGSTLLPIPFLVFCHHRFIKKYKKK